MNYLMQHFWNDDDNRIDGKKLWDAVQPHIANGDLIVNFGQGEREGLVLITYSKLYPYSRYGIMWEPLMEQCRGIIFDAYDNYKIIALPFKKFFNYGEGDVHYPSDGARITGIFTKEDGSLGVAFYWHDKWHITTRGSLNSDIGMIAQNMLEEFGGIPETASKNQTIMFEIVF